jgi:hypothetical protein
LSTVAAHPIELVAYRAAAYRTPVRARDHGGGDGGRYHDPGSEATQYFSLHPLGPWAEQVRNQRCRSMAEALEIRLPVWAARVVLPSAPVVVDFDSAADGRAPFPITAEELVSDNHEACRALGRALRLDPLSPKAIRVPSAALPGTETLVIFGRRRGIEYLASPSRGIQIPYAASAHGARIPSPLFEHVRLHGEPHAGLEAWRQGDRHELPVLDESRTP